MTRFIDPIIENKLVYGDNVTIELAAFLKLPLSTLIVKVSLLVFYH